MSVDSNPNRSLAATAAALVTLPVLLGLIVGIGLTITAGVFALVTNVGASTGGPQAEPSLFMPAYSPTPTPSVTPYESPTSTGDPFAEESPTAKGDNGEIELFASPVVASPNEQVDLNGIYLNGDGATLQVQRRDGSTWVDFPVTVSVESGSFTTYVSTSRLGDLRFRMLDVETGRTSNVVTVTITDDDE
jgi:hypothetical protein